MLIVFHQTDVKLHLFDCRVKRDACLHRAAFALDSLRYHQRRRLREHPSLVRRSGFLAGKQEIDMFRHNELHGIIVVQQKGRHAHDEHGGIVT